MAVKLEMSERAIAHASRRMEGPRQRFGYLRSGQDSQLQVLIGLGASVGELLAVLLIDFENLDPIRVSRVLKLPVARVRELLRSSRRKIASPRERHADLEAAGRANATHQLQKPVPIRCPSCGTINRIRKGDGLSCESCSGNLKRPRLYKNYKTQKGK